LQLIEIEGWVIEGCFDRKKGDEELYLVKWKGSSHRHNTWHSLEYLRSFKGVRRAENFARKCKNLDAFRDDTRITPFEINSLDDDIEHERSLIEDYKIIERVINTREVEPGHMGNENGGTEYLCKWSRLSYGECTWESLDSMLEEDQVEIDNFLERNQSQMIPHKSDTYIRQRGIYKPFQTQPSYLDVGGTLRDYQLLGVNWMAHLWHKNCNGILAEYFIVNQ
jgi:chromodomain-helicase-DNA-binding protein 1